MINDGERLFVDQYNNHFFARTVKELRQQVRGRCSPMYQDKKNGGVVRVGYVIGQHWLMEFRSYERKVSR